MARKRELISPHPWAGDWRYILRDDLGRWTGYQVNRGQSLSHDVRQHALHEVPPGYGNRGDQRLYPWSGQGRIKLHDEGTPRPATARFAFGHDGTVTAFVTDLVTLDETRWHGTMDEKWRVYLVNLDWGPFPVTACGRIGFDQTQALVVELAAGGAGLIPGTAQFTLWPDG